MQLTLFRIRINAISLIQEKSKYYQPHTGYALMLSASFRIRQTALSLIQQTYAEQQLVMVYK